MQLETPPRAVILSQQCLLRNAHVNVSLTDKLLAFFCVISADVISLVSFVVVDDVTASRVAASKRTLFADNDLMRMTSVKFLADASLMSVKFLVDASLMSVNHVTQCDAYFLIHWVHSFTLYFAIVNLYS